MFDILVDHQKKRYYLWICFLSVMILGSIAFDLIFGLDMLKAEGFSEMIDVMGANSFSYYGYFFYSLITSPALYSYDVLRLFIQTVCAFITSFNFFDWMCVIGIIGFIVSHKNKMSRVTLIIQLVYIGLRIGLIILMTVYLYPALMTNNANMALSRIHSVSFIIVVIQILMALFMGGYLFNVIKLFYLPSFEEVND